MIDADRRQALSIFYAFMVDLKTFRDVLNAIWFHYFNDQHKKTLQMLGKHLSMRQH